MSEIYVDVAPYVCRRTRCDYEDFMSLRYVLQYSGNRAVYNGPDLYYFTTKNEAKQILNKSTVVFSYTAKTVNELLIGGATYATSTGPVGINILESIYPPNQVEQAKKEKKAEFNIRIQKNVIQKFVDDGGHIYQSTGSVRNVYILTKRKLH